MRGEIQNTPSRWPVCRSAVYRSRWRCRSADAFRATGRARRLRDPVRPPQSRFHSDGRWAHPRAWPSRRRTQRRAGWRAPL